LVTDGGGIAGADGFGEDFGGGGFEGGEVFGAHVEIVEEEDDEAVGWRSCWRWGGILRDRGGAGGQRRGGCEIVVVARSAFFYGEAGDLEGMVFVEELEIGLGQVADGAAASVADDYRDDDGVDGDFDGGAGGWGLGLRRLLGGGSWESEWSCGEDEGDSQTWVAEHVT
jgi:hypothetical protein